MELTLYSYHPLFSMDFPQKKTTDLAVPTRTVDTRYVRYAKKPL